jgi:hypothetical protein
MTIKKAAVWAQRHSDPLRPWVLHKLGRRDLALLVRAEQAPNPQSRIILTDQRDALGMPRVALDWHLNRLDIDSVGSLVDLLDQELLRLGMGRAQAAQWLRTGTGWQTDPLISARPIGGYHHIGTTRMSARPTSRTSLEGNSKPHVGQCTSDILLKSSSADPCNAATETLNSFIPLWILLRHYRILNGLDHLGRRGTYGRAWLCCLHSGYHDHHARDT